MKKKIIITGSSGFIGSALVKWLHRKYEIYGIDRRPPSDELFNIKDFRHYQYDIVDKLPNLQMNGEIYAVIHLAARPGVRDSRENFEGVCRDNILGTQRILDKCVDDWKPEMLLLASSSSVYGDNGSDGHPLKETDAVNPRSPYAMSKLADEMLMHTYMNSGLLDGIECSALRFFTVFGPNQRNELSIRAFTDWILRDEPITLYGTGEQLRDFTHIDDICSGIETLLDADIIPHLSSIHNIGSGDSHSINEIIHFIGTYLQKEVKINYQPRNIFDVDKTLADTYRMKDLGWHPKVDFWDGLRGQIEWQKEQMK